jgi:hypothetical protein
MQPSGMKPPTSSVSLRLAPSQQASSLLLLPAACRSARQLRALADLASRRLTLLHLGGGTRTHLPFAVTVPLGCVPRVSAVLPCTSRISSHCSRHEGSRGHPPSRGNNFGARNLAGVAGHARRFKNTHT